MFPLTSLLSYPWKKTYHSGVKSSPKYILCAATIIICSWRSTFHFVLQICKYFSLIFSLGSSQAPKKLLKKIKHLSWLGLREDLTVEKKNRKEITKKFVKMTGITFLNITNFFFLWEHRPFKFFNNKLLFLIVTREKKSEFWVSFNIIIIYLF